MKVTKNTGKIGAVLVVLTLLVFIAYPIILLEPMQSVYANHKYEVPINLVRLFAVLWGVVESILSMTAFLMIRARQFDEKEVQFDNIKTKGFIIWSLVWIGSGLLICGWWYNGL